MFHSELSGINYLLAFLQLLLISISFITKYQKFSFWDFPVFSVLNFFLIYFMFLFIIFMFIMFIIVSKNRIVKAKDVKYLNIKNISLLFPIYLLKRQSTAQCCNKILQTCWGRQHFFFVFLFWRLEPKIKVPTRVICWIDGHHLHMVR